MMQQTLLQQGLDLMLYGMGTVIVFLTLLVFAIQLSSVVIRRFFPEVIASVVTSESATTSIAVDPTVLKVIQRAIDAHRNKHHKQ